MTLTKEQRDALRNLADTEKHYTGRTVADAARAVVEAFAAELRPPKMATRWHSDGDGINYRVVRDSDDGDFMEYRTVSGIRRATVVGRTVIAAARDTEFHEVED
jgi:hypothetical protein